MHLSLVGSGPSLQDAGRGPEIDSADAVMRLFDCHWQTPEDHGRIWTYGMIPGPWKGREGVDFARYVRDLKVGPHRAWYAYHFGQVKSPLPRNTTLVDCRRWNERGIRYSGKSTFRITRGFAMFAAAAQIEGVTRITGYGFDAIRAGSLDGYAYHRKWNGPVNLTLAALRHDFGAELRMLSDITAETGIEIDLK